MVSDGKRHITIVGAGTAGLSLAYFLLKRGVKVTIYEASTAETPENYSNCVSDTQDKGGYLKRESRNMGLGGNSGAWGGLVAGLDSRDFSDGSWPFDYTELENLYDAIPDEFGIPRYCELKGDSISGSNDWFKQSQFQKKVFLARKPAPNFYTELRQTLHANEDFALKIDHKCEELIFSSSNKHVEAIVCFSRAGDKKIIRVRDSLVLCLNAVENARVMLNSYRDDESSNDGAIGRYFMDHPKVILGYSRFSEPRVIDSVGYGFKRGDRAGFIGFHLGANQAEHFSTGNHYFRLEPMYEWSDNRYVARLIRFASNIGLAEKTTTKTLSLLHFSETGEDQLDLVNRQDRRLQAFGLLRYLFFRLTGKKPRAVGVRVRLVCEIEPLWTNRITLSSQRNENGYFLADLTISFDERTVLGFPEFVALIDQEFSKLGLNPLEKYLTKSSDMPTSCLEASHHAGTTRMGLDPASSVVDASQRVHGTSNFYVAGASVFPRVGCANPTLTIIALNLRLANKLASLTPT